MTNPNNPNTHMLVFSRWQLDADGTEVLSSIDTDRVPDVATAQAAAQNRTDHVLKWTDFADGWTVSIVHATAASNGVTCWIFPIEYAAKFRVQVGNA